MKSGRPGSSRETRGAARRNRGNALHGRGQAFGRSEARSRHGPGSCPRVLGSASRLPGVQGPAPTIAGRHGPPPAPIDPLPAGKALSRPPTAVHNLRGERGPRDESVYPPRRSPTLSLPIERLSDAPDFDTRLRRPASPLRRARTTTLQVNLGLRCNLARHHCHVESDATEAPDARGWIGCSCSSSEAPTSTRWIRLAERRRCIRISADSQLAREPSAVA